MATDCENLRKTLANLEAQYDHLNNLPADSEQLTVEGIRESVVQRFEICYDVTWTTLRRYLRDELRLPEVPSSPKPVFRIAAQNRLLDDSASRWQLYAKTRVETTHMYDEEKVLAALALIPEFIVDVAELYGVLAPDRWNE